MLSQCHSNPPFPHPENGDNSTCFWTWQILITSCKEYHWQLKQRTTVLEACWVSWRIIREKSGSDEERGVLGSHSIGQLAQALWPLEADSGCYCRPRRRNSDLTCVCVSPTTYVWVQTPLEEQVNYLFGILSFLCAWDLVSHQDLHDEDIFKYCLRFSVVPSLEISFTQGLGVVRGNTWDKTCLVILKHFP